MYLQVGTHVLVGSVGLMARFSWLVNLNKTKLKQVRAREIIVLNVGEMMSSFGGCWSEIQQLEVITTKDLEYHLD